MIDEANCSPEGPLFIDIVILLLTGRAYVRNIPVAVSNFPGIQFSIDMFRINAQVFDDKLRPCENMCVDPLKDELITLPILACHQICVINIAVAVLSHFGYIS